MRNIEELSKLIENLISEVHATDKLNVEAKSLAERSAKSLNEEARKPAPNLEHLKFLLDALKFAVQAAPALVDAVHYLKTLLPL